MLEKEEFIKKLGSIIREVRKSKGLSMEELAHNSNIAYSTLSCLERGTVGNFQIYNLYKLVENLDIDPSLIFKEHDKATKNKAVLINKISSLDDKDLKGILESLKKLTD
ncbi:MAG: transcriptional regulator with XRE-family HTH domain [Rickettsiales bacterium]|jgi:transcriptional regulator with XRE-family HTH domain